MMSAPLDPAPFRSGNSVKINAIFACPICKSNMEPLLLHKDGDGSQNIWWTCSRLKEKKCNFPLLMPKEVYWVQRTVEEISKGHIPHPRLDLLPVQYHHLYPVLFPLARSGSSTREHSYESTSSAGGDDVDDRNVSMVKNRINRTNKSRVLTGVPYTRKVHVQRSKDSDASHFTKNVYKIFDKGGQAALVQRNRHMGQDEQAHLNMHQVQEHLLKFKRSKLSTQKETVEWKAPAAGPSSALDPPVHDPEIDQLVMEKLSRRQQTAQPRPVPSPTPAVSLPVPSPTPAVSLPALPSSPILFDEALAEYTNQLEDEFPDDCQFDAEFLDNLDLL